MKTYTFTWRHASYFGSTLSRCRFEPESFAWPYRNLKPISASPVLAFMYVCCRPDYSVSSRCYRLSSCGRLVARSATYQGV